MHARRTFLFSAFAAMSSSPLRSETSNEEHVAWVAQVLTRMQTIKPGMTRQNLLAVFTTEGGISTGTQRTFVSRDCRYFKVNVRFQPVDTPAPDGRPAMENDRDLIVSISEPYLQFNVTD